MSDSKIFHIIKKHIDQMDYYALRAGGAPCDEFDNESRKISKRLRANQFVQEIADIIAEVFNAAFNEHDTSTIFLSVAEQIRDETKGE